MKDDSIEISTKHLPLRIVGFVLAFAVAVGAFTIGVKKLTGNTAGYTVVSARADGDAPLYAADFRLTYHFEGGSRSIRETKNEIMDAYSAALGRLYKLMDAENEYPGFAGNLAELNRRLNRDIKLPKELFDILSDALKRTEQGEGYSIYDAPLNAEWERIAYASDAEAFDPLYSDDEAERLLTIAKQCADPANCSLEIVDAENCVVRLNAAQSYLDFLEEYELPRIVLDLGQMKNAYILRGTAAALEQRGFSDGFLNTVGGLTVSLSGDIEGEYVIYSYVNNHAEIAATVPLASGMASAAFTAFPTAEDAVGFYSVDGTLRCAVRPAVPGEDAKYNSVFIHRRDGSVEDACYEALCCFLRGEPAAAQDAELVVLNRTDEDGKTLYVYGSDSVLLKPEPEVSIEAIP